jgi:hypothetical protein
MIADILVPIIILYLAILKDKLNIIIEQTKKPQEDATTTTDNT